MLQYNSLARLAELAEQNNTTISRIVLADQAEEERSDALSLIKEMKERFRIMKACTQAQDLKDIKSTSGLTGGDAYRLYEKVRDGRTLTGSVMAGALMRALAVSETNAGMGRIVAAPTAGSCGIVPAALATMEDAFSIPEEDCVMALFTAGAVGMVIATNATVAGASGGCQAECGSASAMAAAAIVELMGGSPGQICDAIAIALKNILGLVCDPVAGLVEIPCIKRNASGVANAFVAAEMVLAGIHSNIPADEVVLAMKHVGDAMSSTLKETAEGGLAATPTGKRLFEQVFGREASPDDLVGCGACRRCR